MQVAYSHDANACAAFARQAAEDWHAFLVHRADELRPGGQLVVLTMAKTDADDFGYRLVIDALIGRSWTLPLKASSAPRKSRRW